MKIERNVAKLYAYAYTQEKPIPCVFCSFVLFFFCSFSFLEEEEGEEEKEMENIGIGRKI